MYGATRYSPASKLTIAAYDTHAARFAERHDVVNMEPHLLAFAEALQPGPVLDAACGGGRDLAWFRARRMPAIGLDRSAGMLAEARKRLGPTAALVQADLCDLPFVKATFAGVWHCASLLHVDKLAARQALVQAWRVLERGGVCAIAVKEGTGSAWLEEEGAQRWFQYYRETEVKELLVGAGFDVLDLQVWQGDGDERWVHAKGRRW